MRRKCPLLRAEMLVAQKAPAEAVAVLEEAKKKDPKRADLWFALSDLARARGETRGRAARP